MECFSACGFALRQFVGLPQAMDPWLDDSATIFIHTETPLQKDISLLPQFLCVLAFNDFPLDVK